MIRSQREYKRAMRKMIRRIKAGKKLILGEKAPRIWKYWRIAFWPGMSTANSRMTGKHSEPWMVKSTLLCSILIFL